MERERWGGRDEGRERGRTKHCGLLVPWGTESVSPHFTTLPMFSGSVFLANRMVSLLPLFLYILFSVFLL